MFFENTFRERTRISVLYYYRPLFPESHVAQSNNLLFGVAQSQGQYEIVLR